MSEPLKAADGSASRSPWISHRIAVARAPLWLNQYGIRPPDCLHGFSTDGIKHAELRFHPCRRLNRTPRRIPATAAGPP
jgi:hypothetical protein